MSSAPDAATVALVPLRAPGVGKSRLAGTLSVEERAALAAAMLADVVAALRAAPVDRIVVAAADADAASAAEALGVETVADPPSSRGLDAALAAATRRLGPVGALLVVAADLPCLTPADVERIVLPVAQVVVAPTDDGGTGGLLRRPPSVCPTAYGPGSADRHLELARAAGCTSVRVQLPGFAPDVDVAADLAGLQGVHRDRLGPRTAEVVAGFQVGTGTVRPGVRPDR